jgi:hypothetical protein
MTIDRKYLQRKLDTYTEDNNLHALLSAADSLDLLTAAEHQKWTVSVRREVELVQAVRDAIAQAPEPESQTDDDADDEAEAFAHYLVEDEADDEVGDDEAKAPEFDGLFHPEWLAPTPQEPKSPVTCPVCGKPADGLDDEHCQEHWEALCSEAWWLAIAPVAQYGDEDSVCTGGLSNGVG